jgi:hypothetical protein
MISMELASKCSICSFQLVRTSEIQFALFEGVEVGEGILDELGCESHGCGCGGFGAASSGRST